MQVNGKEYTITQLQGSLWYWSENKSGTCADIYILSRVMGFKWALLSLETRSNRLQNPVDENDVETMIKGHGMQFLGFIEELDPASLLYEKGILP